MGNQVSTEMIINGFEQSEEFIEYQKRFSKLISPRKLYIEENKICIEYQNITDRTEFDWSITGIEGVVCKYLEIIIDDILDSEDNVDVWFDDNVLKKSNFYKIFYGLEEDCVPNKNGDTPITIWYNIFYPTITRREIVNTRCNFLDNQDNIIAKGKLVNGSWKYVGITKRMLSEVWKLYNIQAY